MIGKTVSPRLDYNWIDAEHQSKCKQLLVYLQYCINTYILTMPLEGSYYSYLKMKT